MSVLVTVGAFALLALWGLVVYRRLLGLRNQVTMRWRQLAAQYSQRRDLVSQLVDSTDGVGGVDPAAIADVMAARDRAASARGPAAAGLQEADVDAALDRLLLALEHERNAASNQQAPLPREALAGARVEIDRARQAYNAMASKYNAATDVFPANIIASAAGFKRAESVGRSVR